MSQVSAAWSLYGHFIVQSSELVLGEAEGGGLTAELCKLKVKLLHHAQCVKFQWHGHSSGQFFCSGSQVLISSGSLEAQQLV